jgi:hypothetical protein
MAKAKSTGKKAKKTVKKTSTPSVKAAAKKASPAKASPAKAARAKPAPVAAPPKAAKPQKAAAKPAPTENWTDAIKHALERRQQQPDYPGAGSDSWKRAKH